MESDRLTRQQRRALERNRKRRERQAVAAAAVSGAALTLGIALAAGQPAQAATFKVTNLNDTGAGSLRQALEDANNAAGADVITFQSGLTGTITLTSGHLLVADSVDVQGPGAAVISVSGNNSSLVFYLYNGDANIQVTISGLTITGGNADFGAGLFDNNEDLVLDGVTIANNTASGDGGALWAKGPEMDLTIRNSLISGNTAEDDGGGIYVEMTGGPLLIRNTVISGNHAVAHGGGIFLYAPNHGTTIENSTISGNTAGAPAAASTSTSTRPAPPTSFVARPSRATAPPMPAVVSSSARTIRSSSRTARSRATRLRRAGASTSTTWLTVRSRSGIRPSPATRRPFSAAACSRRPAPSSSRAPSWGTTRRRSIPI